MALPYVPTTWKSGDLVSSARLNKLEGGVKENSDAILENTADVAQLKSQISEVEAGFPQKSASGSIVTIDDGADNVPVVSLTAQIVPVQSGTGDPAPNNVRPISGWTGANIYQSGEDTSDPTVIPITFPDSAGTVYGGTLKLNQDGTADLTVDRAYKTADSLLNLTLKDGRAQIGAPGIKLVGVSTLDTSLVCDTYPTKTANQTYLHNLGICNSNVEDRVYLYDPSCTTAADYSAKLAANPIHFAYRINNPVTYHITDVDLVKTLYGLNNIWCDTGDIDLVYRADPSMYNAEQIQTMLNAMVAPVEQSTTASKAYNVNDFLVMDGTLYKVIANIASGGTITINTNVSATTIGAEITNILNN